MSGLFSAANEQNFQTAATDGEQLYKDYQSFEGGGATTTQAGTGAAQGGAGAAQGSTGGADYSKDMTDAETAFAAGEKAIEGL